jgi:ketosteroid isomerase-like protein
MDIGEMLGKVLRSSLLVRDPDRANRIGERQMKKIITAIRFVFVVAGLVFAHSPMAPSASLSDADTLKQLEIDWANASKAADVNWCSQLMADDWRGVGPTGMVKTKEIAINAMQTRDFKLESTDFGPMYVKVWGNVGVVQGGTTVHLLEKDGQHTTYKWAWMDVFEKRGDKWVVTLSQISKLE